MKTRDMVVELLKAEPEITQSEMAKRLGKTIDGIRYHIDKLKEEQIIERVGGDKGGYWKIND